MIEIRKKDFEELYNIACKDWKKKFNSKFENFIFSDTISFEESFLQEMENACDDKQLKVFKSIFKEYLKEDLFSITSYSEICKRLKEKELTIEDFNHLPKYIRYKNLIFSKLQQIARLFNGEWKVDLNNSSQKRWYPYFITSGGFAFSDSNCISGYCCGMVVYFKDEKTANYVGNTFINLYKKLYS